MNKDPLTKILQNHIHWLKQDCEDWENMKADLRGANLVGANLRYTNLVGADLRGADLSGVNLVGADLGYTNLVGVNLSGVNLVDANLSGANFRGANLRGANLVGANLRGANLSDANLSGANLSDANLSGVKGLKSSIDYLTEKFEKCEKGIIAYKTFGGTYSINHEWKIKPGSIISENVNANRTNNYGCGINVAPLDWVKNNCLNCKGDIWKVLIKWEWLCGVVVPYNTDGKIRCERAQLIEIVE